MTMKMKILKRSKRDNSGIKLLTRGVKNEKNEVIRWMKMTHSRVRKCRRDMVEDWTKGKGIKRMAAVMKMITSAMRKVIVTAKTMVRVITR